MIRVSPLDAQMDAVGDVFELLAVHQGNRLLKTPRRRPTPTSTCVLRPRRTESESTTIVNRNASENRAAEFDARAVSRRPAEPTAKLLVPFSLDANGRKFRHLDEQLTVLTATAS